MTLKVGSNIHFQAKVDSTVGMMKGSRMKARVNALPRKLRLSSKRQPQAERELEDCGDHRIDEGVPHGGAGRCCRSPDATKLCKPTKRPGTPTLVSVTDSYDAFDEGIGDEQPQQHHRRQQQDQREPALVLQQPRHRPALRRAGVGALSATPLTAIASSRRIVGRISPTRLRRDTRRIGQTAITRHGCS